MTNNSNPYRGDSIIALDTAKVAEGGLFGARERAISEQQFLDSVDRMALLPSTQNQVAAYVHLPFCPTRCISCDRVAEVSHDPMVIDQYLDTLNSEFELVSSRIGRGWRMQQLLVGGGTPNYLSGPQLVRLVTIIERHFHLDSSTRMAIECNPSRTSLMQMQLLRGLGFKELRFELREIDPLSQVGLGRSHSPELLQDAIRNARKAGFERISIELMYGLPGQTVESVKQSLDALAEMSPDEVICSPFIRKEQRFENQKMLDPEVLPTVPEKMALFAAMIEVLEQSDFEWLGTNTFVRKSDVLAKAHTKGLLFRNRLGYTGTRDLWVLGFGVGAVSELPNLLAQNTVSRERWQNAVINGTHPVTTGVILSAAEAAERVAIADLGAHLAVNEGDITTPVGMELVRRLKQAELVVSDHGTLRVTEVGRHQLPQFWDTGAADIRWMSSCD